MGVPRRGRPRRSPLHLQIRNDLRETDYMEIGVGRAIPDHWRKEHTPGDVLKANQNRAGLSLALRVLAVIRLFIAFELSFELSESAVSLNCISILLTTRYVSLITHCSTSPHVQKPTSQKQMLPKQVRCA